MVLTGLTVPNTGRRVILQSHERVDGIEDYTPILKYIHRLYLELWDYYFPAFITVYLWKLYFISSWNLIKYFHPFNCFYMKTQGLNYYFLISPGSCFVYLEQCFFEWNFWNWFVFVVGYVFSDNNFQNINVSSNTTPQITVKLIKNTIFPQIRISFNPSIVF